jgi:hypothetical protein
VSFYFFVKKNNHSSDWKIKLCLLPKPLDSPILENLRSRKIRNLQTMRRRAVNWEKLGIDLKKNKNMM